MRDFVTDKTAAVYDYADKNGLVPDFVKQASIITEEEVQELPDAAFADPVNRLYPCHTKQATVLSAIYSLSEGIFDGPVADTINKRASVFDVTEQVEQAHKHFSGIVQEELQKSASEQPQPIEKYALTLSDGDKSYDFYNVSTRPDVLVSLNQVEKDFNAGNIELPWMRKVSSALLEEARHYGVEDNAPGCVLRYAEVRLPNMEKAATLMTLRSQVVDDMTPYDQLFEKMASMIGEAEGFDEAMQAAEQCAMEMYIMDKQAGVQYNPLQPDPYTIVFCGPKPEDFEKHASEHVYISQVAVPVEDIVNVSDSKIDEMFSKSSAQVIKDAVKPLRDGEVTSDVTGECHVKLANLAPDVRLKLLEVLASTGF